MNLWDIHLHRFNIKPSLVPFLSWWPQVYLVAKHILNTRLAFFRNSHLEVFCWKVFLKFSQNSQETPTILDKTENHFPQFMKYKMKTNPNKIILEICDTKGKTEFTSLRFELRFFCLLFCQQSRNVKIFNISKLIFILHHKISRMILFGFIFIFILQQNIFRLFHFFTFTGKWPYDLPNAPRLKSQI